MGLAGVLDRETSQEQSQTYLEMPALAA